MRQVVPVLLASLLLIPSAALSAQTPNGPQASRSLIGRAFVPQLLGRDGLPQRQLPRVRVSLNPGSPVDSHQPPIIRPIGGGLIGAVVGTVTGGFIGGYWAARESSERNRDAVSAAMYITLGFLAGVALGEPWGAACGVHIGNRRQGDPLPSIVVSVALAAAGIGAALAAEDWRILLAIPVAQIGAGVAMERSTARGGPRRTNLCGPWGNAQGMEPY
jgi:hypothetical protein